MDIESFYACYFNHFQLTYYYYCGKKKGIMYIHTQQTLCSILPVILCTYDTWDSFQLNRGQGWLGGVRGGSGGSGVARGGSGVARGGSGVARGGQGWLGGVRGGSGG